MFHMGYRKELNDGKGMGIIGKVWSLEDFDRGLSPAQTPPCLYLAPRTSFSEE